MNYKGKKIAVTGVNSFIGSAVVKRLQNLGAEVYSITGDTRDLSSFSLIDYKFDYLFHFAAPSSQVLFKRKPAYCIETTLKGLMNAAETCRKHGIRLIYPSTGLLSSDRYNEYAMCKKISEDYVKGLGIDALGVRIFATYGPGEGHKADYASVPYLFARDLVQGKTPVIYGDGTQSRDFVFIDDVVGAIVHLAEECHDPIIDVGSGVKTSFNELIEIIRLNIQLYSNSKPDVEYIDRPAGYVDETKADPTALKNYYDLQVDIPLGVKRMVDTFKRRRA